MKWHEREAHQPLVRRRPIRPIEPANLATPNRFCKRSQWAFHNPYAAGGDRLSPFLHGFPQCIQKQITRLCQSSTDYHNFRIKQTHQICHAVAQQASRFKIDVDGCAIATPGRFGYAFRIHRPGRTRYSRPGGQRLQLSDVLRFSSIFFRYHQPSRTARKFMRSTHQVAAAQYPSADARS